MPTRAAKSALKLLPLEALEQAAECLRTLAHPHRLRMVQLMLNGEYTVGELAEACGVASHVASEHLRLMKHCSLLESERDGRRTYYRVAEPQLSSIMTCIESRFGAASHPRKRT
jgi:DNA-binding transcriptional ArsR family regulator